MLVVRCQDLELVNSQAATCPSMLVSDVPAVSAQWASNDCEPKNNSGLTGCSAGSLTRFPGHLICSVAAAGEESELCPLPIPRSSAAERST